jgi:predicted nuclease of predicted toxin-antitoxin system
MNGFLFDENLPSKILFTPSFPIIHVSILGNSPTDSYIWQYAKENSLVIVTKDVDFSDRLMLDLSPPKVIHLRFGNMRKSLFHSFLASVWSQIEDLVVDHKLINVYLDQIEAFK